MSTNTYESIVEKVRAILDRANHPNTPQAEAETAFAMAQKLITKYSIDESALADAGTTDEIVRDRIDIRGKWALARLRVASSVARANSCSTYRSNLYEKVDGEVWTTKTGVTLHVFGTKADVFATKTLWASVELLALRTIPKGDRSYKNSWWLGFANGIATVLRKANNEAVDESGSSALVLVERGRRSDAEMRAQVKGLRTTYSRGASRGDAYGHGREAGRSFNPGGIGSGAIGAIGR